MRSRRMYLLLTATVLMAMGLACGCSAGAGGRDDAEAPAADEAQGAQGSKTADAQAASDGFSPAYIEAGSGEPLILLHGNGGSSLDFASQIAYFQNGYHVYALDTRGHGNSPRGTAPFTLDQFSDDLLGFMDAQGIGKAHLLGFSDGANIAMLFALAHPERVSSLVLYGGNLYPEGLTEQTRAEIDAEYEQALATGNKAVEELMLLMTEEPHIDPADLSRLDMPTLVVAGSNDMIEEEHTRLIADSIPGARLVILDGSHFVAFENPDAFNEAVDGFLSNLD